MIPKKIYLNAKTLENPKTRDGEPKAIRVKTFPSKGDAEYINAASLWHGIDECDADDFDVNQPIIAVTPNLQPVITDGDELWNCRQKYVTWAYFRDVFAVFQIKDKIEVVGVYEPPTIDESKVIDVQALSHDELNKISRAIGVRVAKAWFDACLEQAPNGIDHTFPLIVYSLMHVAGNIHNRSEGDLSKADMFDSIGTLFKDMARILKEQDNK